MIDHWWDFISSYSSFRNMAITNLATSDSKPHSSFSKFKQVMNCNSGKTVACPCLTVTMATSLWGSVIVINDYLAEGFTTSWSNCQLLQLHQLEGFCAEPVCPVTCRELRGSLTWGLRCVAVRKRNPSQTHALSCWLTGGHSQQQVTWSTPIMSAVTLQLPFHFTQCKPFDVCLCVCKCVCFSFCALTLHNVRVYAWTIRCFNALKQCGYTLKLTKIEKIGTQRIFLLYLFFKAKTKKGQ